MIPLSIKKRVSTELFIYWRATLYILNGEMKIRAKENGINFFVGHPTQYSMFCFLLLCESDVQSRRSYQQIFQNQFEGFKITQGLYWQMKKQSLSVYILLTMIA